MVVLRHLACAALLLLADAAYGQAPSEDPRDVALALARAGVELLEAGDADGAYRSFEQAEQHFHAPTHVVYMARARAKQGQLIEALVLYRAVLAEQLDEEATEPYLRARADAERELAELEPRIPNLTVELRVEARVFVDGVELARERLAEPIALNPGKHRVVARPPGRPPLVRSIVVAEAARERVVLELVSAAPPLPAPRPPPPVVLVPESRPVWIVPAAVAFAVGGVGITAGAITGIITLDRVSELDQRCPDRVCPLAEEDGADDTRTLAHVSTAAFVVGGASLIAGTVLVIVRPGARRLDVNVGQGGTVWLRGTF